MRNSKVLSGISIILLGAFILLSIGSGDWPIEGLVFLPYAVGAIDYTLATLMPQSEQLGWIYSIYYNPLEYPDLFRQERSSTTDSHGRLHGDSENRLTTSNNSALEKKTDADTLRIIGIYEHGLRHGWHEYFLSDGSLYDKVYYEGGRRAEPPENDGSAASAFGIVSQVSSQVLSFEILRQESPWFLFKMNAYGYELQQIEDFMASLQSRIIFHAPWSEADFTEAFRESVEDVRANDTLLVRLYEFINTIEGLIHLRNFELRRAVFDRYLGNGGSTYEILQEQYLDFLDELLALLSEDAIKAFVDDLDERMDNEGPIDLNDAEYIQLIDERMVAMINDMFVSFEHLFTLLVIQTMVTDMIFEANPVHEALKAAYFVTSVDEEGMENLQVPVRITLGQNYPNPFNPVTNIRYTVPEHMPVQLIVYDTVGKEIAVLVDKEKNPGIHQVTFDASHLASGVYVYRLSAGGYVETRRAVLVK